jgi:2-polyprenyl-6-methoxyphenol hydroxylase-like FAD-dependent oxidoreductase
MLDVVVAGGSISGLCAGIALRGIGCTVTICERTPGTMKSRGAGLLVQPRLLRLMREGGAPELPSTSCRYRRHLLPDDGDDVPRTELPLHLTSWSAIYRTLKAAFPADRYHPGSSVTGFDQRQGNVLVHFADGGDIRADLLVCADGSRSELRRTVAPDARQAYAGYVAWRGTVEEKDAPAGLMRYFDGSFTVCEGRSGGHILCYVIPGPDTSTGQGARQLNWVWYVHVPEGPELEAVLTDSDGVTHPASVQLGMVPAERVAAVHALAARELHPRLAELVGHTREPFIQAIFDVTVPRMTQGRACLVGDAAFLVRPHPGAATAKAAADAMALADALRSDPHDLSAALRVWEARQLEYGRSLAAFAAAVGELSVNQVSPARGQADLARRFEGVSPVPPPA